MAISDLREGYLVNEAGHRVAILLDIEEYKALLEAQEELDAIRAYDAAISSGDEAIPFHQAIHDIENPKG
jgi:hypothetical protein